ncbi:MAG: hypothetical protein KME42_02905 [Tildeniella nuda ZEHNDER 1965/U140]|jgi:hypothetical protein|nr:hypothetical protein [Tildeniella nuda ZEHNDER 1965/U140]
MLKLTYIEDGLHLERMTASLDVLIAQRVLLALRAGQKLYVEPGNAAFLLPADAPGLTHLELALKLDRSQSITVTPVDTAFIEVSLQGSWIAEDAAAHEGMFITAFSDRAEFFVYKLWQMTQLQVSSFL